MRHHAIPFLLLLGPLFLLSPPYKGHGQSSQPNTNSTPPQMTSTTRQLVPNPSLGISLDSPLLIGSGDPNAFKSPDFSLKLITLHDKN